jgi:hypothetical protein
MTPHRPLGSRVPRLALFTAALVAAPLAACGYGGSGGAPASGAEGSPQLDRLRMPPGFAIEIYSAAVPGARSLTTGPSGVVFVGTRDQGRV